MTDISGSAWSDGEIRVLIDAYKEMLTAELEGVPYVKRRFNERVQAALGRSQAAIEFKWCNLSAVLRDAGRAYIQGYKPRSHFQIELRDAVSRRLDEFPYPEGWQAPDATSWHPEGNGELEPQLPKNDMYVPDHSALRAVGLDGRQKPVVSRSSTAEEPNLADDHGDFWTRVSALWERSTGGQDVAERPTDGTSDASLQNVSDLDRIESPRPAGVSEACTWFKEGLDLATVPRFLFLVGGPGAGKSHAVRQLVSPYKRVSPTPDGLAHRTYEYETTQGRLVLVNDATIPSDEFSDAPLVHEISAASSGQKHLVACVNRGILVEEQKQTAGDSSSLGAGKSVLNWMQFEEWGAEETGGWRVETFQKSDYLAQGQLTFAGAPVADIVAIYVDVCSLLERTPAVEHGAGRRLLPGGYQIGDTVERLSWADDATSAGFLLNEIANSLALPSHLGLRTKLNPVAANLKSLSSPTVRAGLLATLRAAEIANGQRFSYREIWGAIVRSIVGDLPELMGRSDIHRFVEQDEHVYADDPIEDFEHVMDLAGIRMSQSLFGVAVDPGMASGDPRRNPVTRLTHVVDPMRDATPGVLSEDPGTGWASPITGAFSGPSSDGSPLQSLEENLNEAQAHQFRTILTEFDRHVDDCFKLAMQWQHTKERDRARFVHWYGSYLGRLYALSNGVSAFRREIRAWSEACYYGTQVPQRLKIGLRALLRPKRQPHDTDSRSLIPILDSRTDPVVGTVTTPKIALETGNFDMTIDRTAESLFLVLTEGTTEIARMPLDLALIREAGACTNDYPGMTELTETTSPRLERFRSARLVPDRLGLDNYRIVHGDGDTTLTVNPALVEVGVN